MSSVGYGGYTASTPMGRGMTILTALIGAFLLAILVAIITDLFLMTDRQTEAIGKMSKDRFAGECLKTAFAYNITRQKRYRLLRDGNENNDHIPTGPELTALKEKMYQASANFKKAIKFDAEDR